MRQLFVSLLAGMSFFSVADTLIHAGTIITAEGKQILQDHTIVVRDNKIHALRKGFVAAGNDDTVIDLSQHTVLPGLMDMHTHLSYQHEGPSTYMQRFQLNGADYALRAAHFAEKTLMAGFTTVRNLGDSYNETVALRKAIGRGMAIGPRIFTTGKSIATTGGHADPTNGTTTRIMGDPGPREGVVNGVSDARKAVRQRYKDGADLIKITATGGVLSLAKNGQNPQFMQDELNAIVATAKDYGMTVAVHAHGKEGMLRAIKAGVDSIEHGTYMDEEVMQAMVEAGTFYVPTVIAGNFVAQKAKIKGFFPEVVRPKAAAIGPLIQNTFGKAHAYGVKIAFGTDSGVSPHGTNAEEFSLMVEAGMSAHDAILSATAQTADLLNIDGELGSISEGKLADIIAVAGDPLQDVSVLESVAFVMKDGQVYKHVTQ